MQLRWPFVGRGVFEEVRHQAVERLARLEVLADAWDANMRALQAENRRLTDLIVEMKRDGFHPAPPPDAMPSPDPDLPSQITEAIMARSTRKSDLERELYRYALRAHAQGTTAEEIASTIWHGGDPQEDE